MAIIELGQVCISFDINNCKQQQSQLGSQYKVAKQWLKKVRELVQERIENLKSLKTGNMNEVQAKKVSKNHQYMKSNSLQKGKKEKLHQWALKYSNLLQDIKWKGKKRTIVEKVLESDDISQIEEPSSPKMEAKQVLIFFHCISI